MRFRHPVVPIIVVVLLSLFLSGCPVMQPENAAATSIDVEIIVLDPAVYPYGGVHKTPDVAELQVKFFTAGSQTDEIFGNDLSENETFVCGSDGLIADHSGRYTFWGTVAQAGSAGSFKCVYTRDGVQTSVDIPALARPIIQSPPANATVRLGQDLPVVITPGQAVVEQIAINHVQLLTAPTGTTHATIPVAMLASVPTGPGLLIVSQTMPPVVSNSSFHKLTVTEIVSAYVPLTFV
jgi:hypothetical protein